MENQGFLQSRVRSTFFTSLVSISLVLFFLGLFLGSALYLRHFLRKGQEEIEMMVVLSDEFALERREQIAALLKSQPFTHELRYVSRDQAAREFMDAVGKEFLETMDGINPMRASFNIRMKAGYLHPDSIQRVRNWCEVIPGVAEVDFPEKEIAQIRQNAKVMIRVSAVMALLVVVIAWFIIGGTIRLSIYAKRMMLRSMQLIGATNGFIRRPFLRLGVLQGSLAGLLAVALLASLAWFSPRISTDFLFLKESLLLTEIQIMSAGIILFGALLGYLSSYIAVSRFLNKPLDMLQ